MTAQVEIATPICPTDVYDHLTQAREILHWMEALAASIEQANASGHSHRVKHLAGLAHYLGTDWSEHFDRAADQVAKEHGINAGK